MRCSLVRRAVPGLSTPVFPLPPLFPSLPLSAFFLCALFPFPLLCPHRRFSLLFFLPFVLPLFLGYSVCPHRHVAASRAARAPTRLRQPTHRPPTTPGAARSLHPRACPGSAHRLPPEGARSFHLLLEFGEVLFFGVSP